VAIKAETIHDRIAYNRAIMRRRSLLDLALLDLALINLAPFGLPLSSARAQGSLDVAIVGAGIAGLTAARTLIAARKSVMILEARDRIGGRAVTDTGLGYPADLGAAWLSKGALAQALGGAMTPGPQSAAITVSGKALPPDQLEKYSKRSEEIANKYNELREKVPGLDPGRVLKLVQQLDQLAYFELVHLPPYDMQASPAEGLGAAVARFGAKLPVTLNSRALKVDTTGSLVEVVATTGPIQAKAAIVTVPFGQMASGRLAFAPPLAKAKRDALGTLTMAQYTRVALAFTGGHPKAPANSWVTGINKAGLPFDAFVRPQGRDAAILMFAGPVATQVEELGPSGAGAFALTALAEIYGTEIRAAFAGSRASRWGKDPFAQGAWSVAPAGKEAVRGVLAQPHQDRVFFAGEATEEENAGNAEAAYASGLRAAEEAKRTLGAR
jgi:monoamine oxidase